MNTPGTIHITCKQVMAAEGVSQTTGYFRIRQVFNNLARPRKTKFAKVTITEYCDFWGLTLGEYIGILNTKLNCNIIYNEQK